MAEIGSTGLIHYSGIVDEEFLNALKGTKGIQTYKEMSDNDSIVGAILYSVDMLIRNVKWRIEPANNDLLSLRYADFLESCMHDMSMTWDETISEILSMLIYGWSFHEIVYKKD